jgi:hypothetical protein
MNRMPRAAYHSGQPEASDGDRLKGRERSILVRRGCVDKQLSSACNLEPQRPRNIEALFINALDAPAPEVLERVRAWRAEGWGARAIAEALGISRKQAQRLIKRI